VKVLGRIADFAGLRAGAELVADAVQRSSFQRMRELERRAAMRWQPRAVAREVGFVRGGKVGEGIARLGPDDLELIATTWARQMHWAGYPAE
jgi:hypothetical protein